jgi:hypothetical protein
MHYNQYVTQFPKEGARRKLPLFLLEDPSCSSDSPLSPYLLFKETRAKNVELLIRGCVKPGDVTSYGKERLMSSYCLASGQQNHIFCSETRVLLLSKHIQTLLRPNEQLRSVNRHSIARIAISRRCNDIIPERQKRKDKKKSSGKN